MVASQTITVNIEELLTRKIANAAIAYVAEIRKGRDLDPETVTAAQYQALTTSASALYDKLEALVCLRQQP